MSFQIRRKIDSHDIEKFKVTRKVDNKIVAHDKRLYHFPYNNYPRQCKVITLYVLIR